jgi:hypothetical protein
MILNNKEASIRLAVVIAFLSVIPKGKEVISSEKWLSLQPQLCLMNLWAEIEILPLTIKEKS